MSVRRPYCPALATALVGAVGLITLSCGDGSSPSTSTPPSTVAPRPSPTPPGDGGGVGATSCPFGKGTPSATCERDATELLPEVEQAIDRVIATRPELFDLTRQVTAGAYLVVDPDGYLQALVDELRRAGLCAEQDYDGAELISVKDSNEFSEDFDVLLADFHIRRGIGAYRQTCSPASFPLDPDPNAPPRGSGCVKPYPPPVTRFKAKVHLKGGDGWTLDSTPMVGPNAVYCAEIGYTDGRALCPVRPEGAPDREACEAWRVGEAADTGRVGPTWTYEGQPCTGPESGCDNHPDNQFQALAYKGGNFEACATNGACGRVYVDR